MKISILTQPLGLNYGGILQAYALQRFLIALGHDVETLNRRTKPKIWKRVLRKIIPAFLLRNKSIKHLTMSPRIISQEDLERYYAKKDFDAVIVGSDQVWRPKYSPCLPNFYLDFLDNIGSRAKRIAYAASFGVDEWEYTDEQTALCKNLIGKFDAVSVRERSAVGLCEKYLGVTPKWLVDPTLLLDPEDYRKLFESSGNDESAGAIVVYILDPDERKNKIAHAVSRSLGKNLDIIQPLKGMSLLYSKIEPWLQAFSNADFVVTDSFHGCVFSIVFNKPFIAIGNKDRGLSRFESLLSLFGLEDRLVLCSDDFDGRCVSKPIDWHRVSEIRKQQADLARAFLTEALRTQGEDRK